LAPLAKHIFGENEGDCVVDFRQIKIVHFLPAVFTLTIHLPKLQTPTPWRDEIATLAMTNKSFSDLLSLLGEVDLVHALYYVHAKVIFQNPTIAELRTLSIVWLAIAATFIYLIANQVVKPLFALFGVLVFLLLPTTYMYAGEARSHTMIAAFTLISFYFFQLHLRTQNRYFTRSTIFLLLSIFTNVLSAVLLSIYAVLLNLTDRLNRYTIQRLIGATFIAISFGILTAAQREQVSWIPKLGILSPVSFINDTFIIALNPQSQAFYFLLFTFTIGFVLVKVLKAGRNTESFGIITARNLLIMSLAPGVMVLAASLVIPLWHPRYVFYSTAFIAILVAIVIASLPAKYLLSGILTISLFAFWESSHWWFRSIDSKSSYAQIAQDIKTLAADSPYVWFVEVERHDSSTRVLSLLNPELEAWDFAKRPGWVPSDSFYQKGLRINEIPINDLPAQIIEVGWTCLTDDVTEQENYLKSIGYEVIVDRSDLYPCVALKKWTSE
jgi:hypothetical protein